MLFSRVKISWHHDHEDITWYFIGVYMIKKDIALGPENNILMIRKGVARARLSIVFYVYSKPHLALLNELSLSPFLMLKS